MDKPCNALFCDYLFQLKLIGSATENIYYQKYSEKLTRIYIENQIVSYPNSMNRSEIFIVFAKRIFADTIIHNSISINELPPWTMNNLRV